MVVPIEGQQRAECRETCDKGAKRTQILGMGCSTLRLALGQGSPAYRFNGRLVYLTRLWALTPAYRITSSARTSSDGGIVIPSALAVLRLRTSSNFIGCSTG